MKLFISQNIAKYLKRLSFFLGFIFILIFAINTLVEQKVKPYLFDDINSVPKNKVGLLLGTSKYTGGGKYINFYYKYRLDAAKALFEADKIEYILISGDNATRYYDEPTQMRKDLIAMGIPDSNIVLDYAGFRTLDSVVRAKKVFKTDQLTVISQKFHNQRAIYIGKYKDMKMIGFNAKDISIRAGFKTQIREKFARVKMMLDLITNKEPKFLGDEIEIG
ncbi:MAG: SanA/YdcF family protein [Flavobacteriales bacterium]